MKKEIKLCISLLFNSAIITMSSVAHAQLTLTSLPSVDSVERISVECGYYLDKLRTLERKIDGTDWCDSTLSGYCAPEKKLAAEQVCTLKYRVEITAFNSLENQRTRKESLEQELISNKRRSELEFELAEIQLKLDTIRVRKQELDLRVRQIDMRSSQIDEEKKRFNLGR